MSRRPRFALIVLGGTCVLGCGLLGNGLYYEIIEFSPTTPVVTSIRLGFLLGLMLVGYFFYKLYKQQFGAPPTLWVAAFLAATIAGAGADSWQAWLESLPRRHPAGFPLGPVLYSIFFFAFLVWAGTILRKYPSLVGVKDAPAEPRSHLVLFLSEVKDTLKYPNCVPSWLSGHERKLCADLKTLAEEKQKAKIEKKAPPLWPWEQPLRAIHHHLCHLCNEEVTHGNRLTSVTVIASKESINQAPLFADLLKAYPALQQIDFKLFVSNGKDQYAFTDLITSVASGGFDFENFTDLSNAVHNMLWRLAQQNLAEWDIMIDFTGGKKVTSVVAAATTFNRDVRAQYVQTEDPWSVLSYSVTTMTRPI